MSITIGVPSKDELVDREYVEVPGADGNVHGFQYDAETNTLFAKESQVVIPSFHGITHVVDDPIPEATPWLRGLISAADKAKLDSLTQTRLGVLGFMGSGMPDDGGYMSGDIILAAGSEFISIERVGNIIRFTADTPIPLSCGCESCAQIYWIQDESDTRSVRPPSCNGIMPGVNSYGELKIFAYPRDRLFNANNPDDYYDDKNLVPTLQFKRYVNGNIQNLAELQMVLRRNSNQTTNVGWSMTPGPAEVPECVWYMGSDSQGRQITFELSRASDPALLGGLLYNGHSITKQMAVVTGYTANILSTNQYNIKLWSVNEAKAVGDALVATNVWKYDITGTTPVLSTDKLVQLLDVGTLVEIWQFEISNINNIVTYSYYFNQRPMINPAHLWSLSNAIRFGDLYEQRDDVNQHQGSTGFGTGTDLTAHIDDVSDIKVYERFMWGITGFEDPLLLAYDGLYDTYGNYEPSGAIVNGRYQAFVDYSIPGLRVEKIVNDTRGDINHDGKIDDADLALLMTSMNTSIGDSAYNSDADFNQDGVVDVRDLAIFGTNYNIYAKRYSDQPVFIWNRTNHKNFLLKTKVGRPPDSDFPPIDILLSAPIDSLDDVFVKIIKRGTYLTGVFANLPYVVVNTTDFKLLPQTGTLRVLTGVYRDILWKYSHKVFDGDKVILVGIDTMFPFDEDYLTSTSGTVPVVDIPTNSLMCQLVHADYTSAAIRLEFSINSTTGSESVQLQFKAGKLSMKTPYDLDRLALDGKPYPYDDFVRGFAPGEFSVSKIYTQVGFISDGVGSNTSSDVDGFKVFDGGLLPTIVNGSTEAWNDLIIMVRDNQLWVWWNNLLISPDPILTSQLPTPVAINTQYWPISKLPIGKVGFRLWPGATLRDISVNDQLDFFNEFTLG
jgi:hypothetical protein